MEIKNTARTVLKKAIIFSLLFAGVTCAYSQILDKNALLKKKAELSEQIKEQEANRDTLLKQQRQLSQQMREIGGKKRDNLGKAVGNAAYERIGVGFRQHRGKFKHSRFKGGC